ncbi:LysR family transcriptional regulator [Microlunatus sp. GCM10028923]|uniref:LysR family transcriptional regulator n=1 Tax=Microlunatus sp. GCM10028923 TaxID=3273400 RepID=UPI003623A694
MDLLTLRYFQTVARLQHVSRAAEQLHVAQPALSRVIRRLEDDLGAPLFDRTGRAVRLNRFGAAYLRRVDRALAELDGGRAELADAVGLDRGTVTVAAETLRLLTPLVAAFLRDHPGVDLRLVESDPRGMTDRLRAGQLDFAFASQPLADPSLRARELIREEVLLVVPAGHRLAAEARVPVAELAGERLITSRPGHWLRTLVERLFADAGIRPEVSCECNEPTVMLDLIGAGLGVGFGPSSARFADPRATVVPTSLDVADCHRTLSLVWCDGAYLSAAARLFRDRAIGHFRLPQ